MRKIAVIGDSHYYTLKRGWQQICPDFPGVDLTFVGAPKVEIGNFAVQDGTLVPTTNLLREHLQKSSGLDCIPGTFDCYVLSATRVYVKFVLEQAQLPGDLVENSVRFFSEDIAMVFLRKLRRCTDAPILFLAPPHQPRDYAVEFREMPQLELKRYSDTFHAACRQLAASVRAHYIPQPEDTIADNLVSTEMRFANNVRNDGRVDRWHTTGEYGAIVMTGVIREALKIISESGDNCKADTAKIADGG